MAELRDGYLSRIPWEPVVNGTNEAIPPFACVRCSESEFVPGTSPQILASMVLKPNDYGAQYRHRIMWHQWTPPGGLGYAALPVNAPMLALCNPSTVGSQLRGPISGSWELQAGSGGFRLVGFVPGGRPDVALVLFEPLLSMTVQLSEDLVIQDGDQHRSAPATPWSASAGGGSIASYTLTVHEDLGGLDADYPSGARARVQWDINTQKWVIIALTCNEEE